MAHKAPGKTAKKNRQLRALDRFIKDAESYTNPDLPVPTYLKLLISNTQRRLRGSGA
jgi:hypothetical protein